MMQAFSRILSAHGHGDVDIRSRDALVSTHMQCSSERVMMSSWLGCHLSRRASGCSLESDHRPVTKVWCGSRCRSIAGEWHATGVI